MYLLTTQEINDLARELQKTHAVYGPQVHAQTGQVFFDLLADTDRLDLDAAIPSMPVKEILFPQMERILKYSYDAQAQSVTLEKQYGEKPKVLFGLRPCDLAGIQCLDRFFLGQEFVDDVYLAHRRQSILITNTCTRPWDQCFCVCTHTGPAADEGFDLDLTRLDDGYLVQVGSEKGQALAEAHGWKTAERRRLAEKTAVVDRCDRTLPGSRQGQQGLDLARHEPHHHRLREARNLGIHRRAVLRMRRLLLRLPVLQLLQHRGRHALRQTTASACAPATPAPSRATPAWPATTTRARRWKTAATSASSASSPTPNRRNTCAPAASAAVAVSRSVPAISACPMSSSTSVAKPRE